MTTWAIHSIPPAPPRTWGHDWPTREAAEHMAQHLAPIVHQPLAVGQWHPLRSLADLPEWVEVHVCEVADGVEAHRDGRDGTAVCGAAVLSTPITAGRLRLHHFGGLCRTCWPGWSE